MLFKSIEAFKKALNIFMVKNENQIIGYISFTTTALYVQYHSSIKWVWFNCYTHLIPTFIWYMVNIGLILLCLFTLKMLKMALISINLNYLLTSSKVNFKEETKNGIVEEKDLKFYELYLKLF